MPLYEYKCPNCCRILEVIQKYDDPFPICEKCKVEMKKLISLSSFRLKGSGWYKTDYAHKE